MNSINRIVLAILCIAFSSITQAQVLDLESTTEGVLIPRMTTAQKDAILMPDESLLVYDTDTKSFWYYEDMVWKELASEFEGVSVPEGTESPNVPIIDGDLAGVSSTITLTDPGQFTADTYIKVCVNIAHPFVGVVNITLTAPDGITVLNLSIQNGGSGVNFTNTCFTTDAVDLINTVTSLDAPFTGNYVPQQAFSDLIGQDIAGDWILTVVDVDVVADAGTFLSWSIDFQYGEPLSAGLLSDTDNDTRVLVEKAVDEDTIRVEIGGIETLKLATDDAEFATSVTAPSFIGDGSQLTGIMTGGSCNIYGDGSAGDVIISSATDWSTTAPTNGNFMFNNLTINAGQTLTVASGTIIMVANDFTNAGTIVVEPSVEGERSSNHIDGPYPRIDGYVLSQLRPYSTNQLRFVLNPKFDGGSSGEDGSISSTVTNVTQEGGSGGGTLVIRAANTINISGTINAPGGNAIPNIDLTADVSGAGGGGGGFVILISELITNTGTIDVSGGDGTDPGTGDDDHAGGGGGGGLVHYVSTNANAVAGTVSLNGGIEGVTPVINLGTTGGDGGSSAGKGGAAGTDTGGFVQPQPGDPGVIIRTQVGDPCSVAFD